jgi:hypothetical protein
MFQSIDHFPESWSFSLSQGAEFKWNDPLSSEKWPLLVFQGLFYLIKYCLFGKGLNEMGCTHWKWPPTKWESAFLTDLSNSQLERVPTQWVKFDSLRGALLCETSPIWLGLTLCNVTCKGWLIFVLQINSNAHSRKNVLTAYRL